MLVHSNIHIKHGAVAVTAGCPQSRSPVCRSYKQTSLSKVACLPSWEAMFLIVQTIWRHRIKVAKSTFFMPIRNIISEGSSEVYKIKKKNFGFCVCHKVKCVCQTNIPIIKANTVTVKNKVNES